MRLSHLKLRFHSYVDLRIYMVYVLKIDRDKLFKGLLKNEIFSKQICPWNFRMEFTLNRGLVREFLDWTGILTPFLVKLKSVEYCQDFEPRQESTRISRSQKEQNRWDLNVLKLTYFLILKKRALVLFSLM